MIGYLKDEDAEAFEEEFVKDFYNQSEYTHLKPHTKFFQACLILISNVHILYNHEMRWY